MLETLGKYRPLFLACFAVAGLVMVTSAVTENKQLFFWGIYTAHIALLLFLMTEAFGPISRARMKLSRIIARIFLVLAVVTVLGTTFALVQGEGRAFY